jgi:hypothetical protein
MGSCFVFKNEKKKSFQEYIKMWGCVILNSNVYTIIIYMFNTMGKTENLCKATTGIGMEK